MIDVTNTIAQLVLERPARSRVFEKYGIDYCCGGKKPLGDVCAAQGLNVQDIVAELNRVDAGSDAGQTDWRQASIDDLVEHIVTVHHGYLKEALPRLGFLVNKVSKVHGNTHPELLEVAMVYERFWRDMKAHMEKEELVLFPACRMLAKSDTLPTLPFGSIRNPISVMDSEHDEAGNALKAMRLLTNGFIPPEEACNSYRAMLDGLAELENDTHLHVHKENNILFPRVAEIEDGLRQLTGELNLA